MIRLLFALSGGALIGSLGLELLTGYQAHPWLWPTAMAVLTLAFVVLIIARTLRGTVLPDGKAEMLLSQGRGALARIESVRQTGTTVNNAHMCVLTLVVAPRDRRAYTTEARMLLAPVQMPGFQPGRVLTVVRPDPEKANVHVVAQPNEEWRRRMAAEGAHIPARDQAPEWESERHRSGTLIGTGERGRGVRVVAYAAVFALGLALPGWLDPAARDKAVAVYIEGQSDYDDFASGERQQVAVGAVVELAGTGRLIEANLYSGGYIIVTAPSAPGAATFDVYSFRDGAASRDRPASIQPQDPEAELFDASEVDWSGIGAFTDEAARLTGIGDPSQASVHVKRGGGQSSEEAAPVLITVAIRDDYYSGTVVFDLDGAVTSMTGGAPGSEAASAE